MLHHPPGVPSSSFASHALRLLQNVRQGKSFVELVYTSHERWPLPPGQTTYTRPAVRISVLDSSFNPPTLAHLALANSLPQSLSKLATSPFAELCDAQMLLLSVRNADKVMKPGDASFVQRLEMMRLLSHVCFTNTTMPGDESLQMSSNVAVAIIDEPTFVGKSALLLRFLQRRLTTTIGSPTFNSVSDRRDSSCRIPSPKLIFLLGFDTLVRIFSSKYYPSEQAMIQMLHKFLSPDQEDCRIVCAYRGDTNASKMFEEGREFITSRRIAFVDIGAAERTYSSSEVRARVAAGDETWRHLVTDGIANYIIKQGIYSGSGRKQ